MKKYGLWILAIIPIYFAIVVCCTPSLHPIYTPDDIIFEPTLIGTWLNEDNDNIWDFAQHDEYDDAYILTYTDETGDDGSFTVRLVEIGDYMFLDLYPRPDIREGDHSSDLMISSHAFLLVKQIEPTLNYQYMDNNWLQLLLEEHPGTLKHELIETDVDDEFRLVLTASTEDLQKFMVEHIETEDAYGEETVLIRIVELEETPEE